MALDCAKDFILLSTVQETETRWLWYPYIPLGKVTILQGDPGEGKSLFSLHLAAAVSRGWQFPETETSVMADYVLYQNAEDGLADTVKPRLRRAGAACQMIVSIHEDFEPLTLTDPRLTEAVTRLEPKLVIIDPIQGYLGDDIDMHRANEIRPVMSHLAALAEQSGAAILLIGHMNKCLSAGKAMYRGLGSIDITAAARSVLLAGRDPEHPENLVLMQLKNSLAPKGKPVGFSVSSEGTLQYLGEYSMTEEKLLSGSSQQRESEIERAKRFLQEQLRGGEQPAKEIQLAAQAEDIGKRTLLRAKQMMGIRAVKHGTRWFWRMNREA